MNGNSFDSVPGGGGTCQKFDRDARPIFLGLKFGQTLFFKVGKFFSYFSGYSNFCITHLNLLNEEHAVLKNKIIVAFHIYSNFDKHSILSHSIFWGLNFGAFYFFGFEFSHSIFLGS